MTDIFEPGAKGFSSVCKSDLWQIATITFDKGYSKENFDHMKRHMTTDEAFMLVAGNAVLHTAENGKMSSIDIEPRKIYLVHKCTWHYLEISEDALLFVVENKEVLPEHTERSELTCLLRS